MDQYGVEETVFCEVHITIFYNFTRTTKFAHMNGHWKGYDFFELYDYYVWVLRFSDDNQRFEVNSPILWLITRKILGQILPK